MKKFPYQIHLILGIIWIIIGLGLHSGKEMMVWIGGGLVMLIVGLFIMKND